MPEIDGLLDLLEFCKAGLEDAILLEDGLDGETGTKLIEWIEEELENAGREVPNKFKKPDNYPDY